LLGMLNFAAFVVPRGRLHCRPLQVACNRLPKHQAHVKRPLESEVSTTLMWWLRALPTGTAIHPDPVSHYVTTDASARGWGAIVNDACLSGLWSPEQKKWHSNLKEMWAVIQALTNRQQLLRHSTVLVQSDNKSVVSYMRNEGGLRSQNLYRLTCMLFEIADENKIHLVSQYLPGQVNTEADMLSRLKLPGEWTLMEEACQEVFRKFGMPEIDLFASKTAHVLARYVSRDCKDSNAEFHDAFSRRWSYRRAWIFPPPHLISRVLSHLNLCKGRYIVIVPHWSNVFRRPDLKRIAVSAPLPISNLHQRLLDTRTYLPPVHVDQMFLEAWLVKGGVVN
jgi:hypothetical protein